MTAKLMYTQIRKRHFLCHLEKNLWQKFNPKARDRGETNDVVNDGTSWPSHTN